MFKHTSLTCLYLILSLSSTSLALALKPALDSSLLDVQPSTNLTIPIQRVYHCGSPATVHPIEPFDCYAAVNSMLTTPDASKTLTFGSRGSYTGPLSWTWASCTVTLSVGSVATRQSSLMLFAQAAAEITLRCHASAWVRYTGGTCSWVQIGRPGVISVAVRSTWTPR